MQFKNLNENINNILHNKTEHHLSNKRQKTHLQAAADVYLTNKAAIRNA